MERQSSFGSQSSAGSAFTSKSATTKLVNEAEKENAIDGQAPGLLTALFGALYTLAKEKINDSANVAMLAIWVDFLMIFTLMLMPEYPWMVDPKSWIFQVFYYIQIHLPIANTGYQFYLVIFYILVAILFISVVICIWVGWCFMNDSFPFLWPIKVARVVVSLFVSMFYIASLNVFLMACACKNTNGNWKHLFFYKLDCLSMPHLIHAAVSLTSGTVFFVVAVLLVLGDHELEPMSKSLLASPHSMCELRSLLCKTVITFADILLKPVPRVQTVLYCISCGLLFYYHARMVPHYVPWINVLRGGLNAVLAWVSIICCILSYTTHWEWDKKNHPYWEPSEYRQMMTTLMAVGVPVSCLAGAAICWGRLVYAWRAALKFKVLPEGIKPRNIHRFWTEFDVEVASRIGRVWDQEGALDHTALAVAENVLKAGVAMKPKSVFMHIAYSNFLIDVRHNIQSGWNHLDLATGLGPNLSYQFSTFTRKQEHKQQSGGGGGGEGGAVDLVSYVEFQKNYKNLMVYHKASLVATRDFWRLLTRDRVPLDRLGHSFTRMDEMESKAEATYKMVLDRYPSNAKLLRSYGKFLESIKNDPWGAARYYAEAEKQEELEENKAADIQVGDDSMVSDKNSAIITINATGTIQMANKVVTQMLGYKKGELQGKNVSVIMPPPFSTRHNSYLRNYINTNKPKILDTFREVVALHKERYVFPVTLKVTKIMGTGVDATFMGVMKPAAVDPGSIKAWLLPTGTILCVDLSFMDYAGWGPQELIGRAFSSLGTDSSELDDLIAQSSSYTEEQLESGVLQIATSIKHKYAGEVPVRIKVTMGGTESQRILVMSMKQLAETPPMGAFDAKGRCIYANSPLASMLGYKLKMLRTKDITQLLPQPYGVMHLKYVKETELPLKSSPNSCRNRMTSVMLTSNNTPVYVIPTIIPHVPAAVTGGLRMLTDGSGNSGSTWAFKVERSTKQQLLNERRLSVGVSAAGKILWASAGTPEALFGLLPRTIIGQDVDRLVDVFADYRTSDPTADIATGLAALVNRVTTRPGTCWRVGVGYVTAADQAKAQGEVAAAAAEAAAKKRILLRQATHKSKAKPAVMVVTLPGDESLPEEAAEAGPEVALFIDLWRADVLMAIAEVVENCVIVRAEPTMGLVCGTTHTFMLHTNLNQWLGLAQGTQLADLMGTKGVRKGGMKSSHMHKTGPMMQLNGLHTDGRPLAVSLQACLKDGTQEGRLVLAIKPVKPAVGAPGMLADLVATEADAGHGDQAATSAVPGLALDKIQAAADLLDTQRGTQRSNMPGSNLVTARGVDVDIPDADGKPGRAPAHLAASPTGSDEARHRRHHHAGEGDSPNGSQQGHDMDVSSGEEEQAPVKQKQKKKRLTEDEMEAMLAAKGANKAREWLDSGFGGFKKADPTAGALALPGAVEDFEAPALYKGAAGSNSADGDDVPDKAAPDKAEKNASEVGSESQATTGTAGDNSLVSDYGRGKRLRKLIRLLSSKTAMQVVVGFRFKVILLVAVICCVHMGAFGALLGFVNKQDAYLDEVEAVGEAADILHRIATLSLVLEAAGRGLGFGAADIPTYAAELETNYNRLDKLHQGLYLGFSGLRSMDTSELYSLWHTSNLNATVYLDASDPNRASVQKTSLFELGSMLVSAAKEVQFAALNPGVGASGPLANSRSYKFLHANGPGTLYSPYLKSLDLMVQRAIDNAETIQLELVALLCVEGVGFMLIAVIIIIRLFRSISVHRQALFSVFLAAPQTFLRTLASKSVSIGDEDADEEEEDDKIMQAAEEAKRQKKKQQQLQEQADTDNPHDEDAWGSMPGGLTKMLDRKAIAKKKGKKAFFADAEGDAAVEVSVKTGPAGKGPGASGKGTFSMGPGAGGPQEPIDRQKLFNGKELVTSAKSAYELSWPILVWGMLVLLLYGISYQNLSSEQDTMVYIKMTQKSRIAASRVTYYTMGAALTQDIVERQRLQVLLDDESAHLTFVYTSALYGTLSLSPDDTAAHGDFEENSGSLFASASHKHLLFDTDYCLRLNQATCLDPSNPFYSVSRHGLDALVMRLAQETKLMGRINATALDITYPGYDFVWQAAWYDLHDGFTTIIHEFIVENKAMFNQQRAIHIVLVLIMALGGIAFLVAMLRPFLKHISKESRRCAELLVQLPPDFDVEGMIAATWSAVKQERLMVERSGRTFLETGGLMGTLRTLSRSFLGGPRPAFHGGQRLSAMGQDGDGKMFSPRWDNTNQAGSTPRYGEGPGPGGRQGPLRESPGKPRGGRAPPQDGFFEPHDDDEEAGNMEGRGGLRHRKGPGMLGPGRGPAGGRGGGLGSPRAAHLRRAIVPVDDDML